MTASGRKRTFDRLPATNAYAANSCSYYGRLRSSSNLYKSDIPRPAALSQASILASARASQQHVLTRLWVEMQDNIFGLLARCQLSFFKCVTGDILKSRQRHDTELLIFRPKG